MKRLVLLFFFFSLFILPLYAKGNRESSRPYTGDGGKNISITIKVLTAEGLPSGLSNTHILAYRGLIDNFKNYSGIFIRRDLDFDNSLYREILSGYYDDDDEAGSDLGHLNMTNYMMTGSISQSPSGYHFSLQIENTAANDKSVAFSFAANCTYSDLSDLSIVNRASLDLLEQMGVELTERARVELAGTDAANRAKGKTIMREAVAAQQAGDEARARFLLNQAVELDAQLTKEAERRLSEMDKPLAMLTTERIPPPAPLPPPQLQNFVPTPERQVPPPAKTTGNIGNDARARQQAYDIEQENERIRREIETENERIREENARRQAEVEAENARQQAEVEAENARRQAAVAAENAARDAHNKGIWVKALADSEKYYRNYLPTVMPFELVYENKIEEMEGSQDFSNKTVTLKFSAALVPVESGWIRAVENDVHNLRSQLLATGKSEDWGLVGWPQFPVTTPHPFVDRNGRVTAVAELVNNNGKVLGSQSFSLDWNLTASFSAKGLSFSINEDDLSSESVLFERVNIDDITDILQIRIAKINGEDAEKVAAQGGIQYSTDYQRWRLIERGQNRRASRKAAGETAVATSKFLVNYILPIPHFLGAGTTFTTPKLVLSAYNRMFFGSSSYYSYFFFDYGCDFGFFHGNSDKIRDVGYHSFYPNGHIGLGIGSFNDYDVGVFLGVGGGCMLATYTFPNDTVNATTPAFDFVIGFRAPVVEFSYSIRKGILVNHKLQLAFRVIPKL
jgi:multidrug efflux pump subunit AcrA (membrane-fusion protein)